MADVRLIDANALKKHLRNLVASGGHKYYRKGMDDTLHRHMPNIIDDQPTVDAVPVVHGEWLDGYATQNGKVVYKSIDCSVCEEYFKIESYDREYWKARFKVCPFCGAKMDLEVPDGQA